jgi:hypothetical protein
VTLAALLAPALSALILAAHFLRAGQWAGVGASLALLVVLAIPRPWAARVAQAALVLGAAEWLRTLIQLVGERRAEHAPYVRLAVILGAVAVLTAVSALVFESRRLRARYRTG